MAWFNKKTETRNMQTSVVTSPIFFAPDSNGFSIIQGSEQLVNTVPALSTTIQQLSTDMSLVKYTGGQASVLNSTNLLVTFRQLLITGNAFLLIKRDVRGVLSGLVSVDTQDVIINLDRGKLSYQITNNSGDQPYDTGLYQDSEILHFMLNPGTQSIERFRGHSPIESLKDSLIVQQLANQNLQAMLKESISPKILLKINSADQDTQKAVKTAFNNVNKDSSTWISDNSVDVQKLFVNNNGNSDSLVAYSKQLSDSADVIAQAFAIPSSMVGNSSSDDNQTNGVQIQQIYLQKIKTKYMSVIISELQDKLNINIQADYSALLPIPNDTDEITNITNLVDAGFIDVDQGRNLLIKKGIIDE